MKDAVIDENNAVLVLCTCPDDASAGEIANQLVAARLAACVNIIPGVTSVYYWQGSVQRDREQQLVIKTTAAAVPSVTKQISEAHPYELPEIIAVRIDDGSEPYLAWINECVTSS